MESSRVRKAGLSLGATAVGVGVVMQVPMFLAARKHHYRLVGMAMDHWMIAGMGLILIGLVAVVVTLTPPRRLDLGATRSLSVAPLDDTKMGPAHLGMLGVLTLAIAIDSQKPFTFEFILPGVAAEYNLSSPGHQVVAALPVALIALVGIAGTVVGSLVWGCVADRWGRRSAILIAAMIFLATCACGAMPAFVDNLVMCFVMGLGAGGLLPIAYTLLAETIPARHRGQVVVLVAGVGTAAGFLLASATASWLMPGFGWRIMWFLGLPSGLCLVGLSGFIPESPRWLISQARSTDAEAILTRFGAQLVEVGTQPVGGGSLPARPSVAGLGPLTAALGIYGVGWGVVNFGFLTWLPTTAGHVGLSVAHISAILTNAALFSLPGALIVSWAYGRVSSKAVLVVVAALNVASLVAFAAFGTTVVTHPWVLTPALVACLVSLWGVISVLAPYAAEVYPTHIRAGGAGIAAGASKFGGVAALAMVVAGVSPPGISGSAILSAAVMGAGALAIARYGIETHHRSLEDIGPPKATAALAGLTP